MQKTLFFSLFLLGGTAFSAERSVTCGDHWFKVSASWTEGKNKASVSFSGDSQPDRSVASATVTEVKKVITITFTDKIGGHLRIDANEDGYLKESKDSKDEQTIASCNVH